MHATQFCLSRGIDLNNVIENLQMSTQQLDFAAVY
jgi:hypothetical protein